MMGKLNKSLSKMYLYIRQNIIFSVYMIDTSDISAFHICMYLYCLALLFSFFIYSIGIFFLNVFLWIQFDFLFILDQLIYSLLLIYNNELSVNGRKATFFMRI